MSIERYNQGNLCASSQIPFFDTGNGQDRRTSVMALAATISGLMPSTGAVTQFAAPNASGFSVAMLAGPVFLLLTPAGAYAAGTLALSSTPADGDELIVHSTQAVTSLTVSGNGNTVAGAPAGLVAGGFFRLRYEGVMRTWYRVG